MAIAPLQLPSSQPFGQQIDFATPLAAIGKSIDTAKTNELRKTTLADLGRGLTYEDAAKRLIANGDMEGGATLAKLSTLGQTDDTKNYSFAQNNPGFIKYKQDNGGVYGTPIYGTDAQGNTVLGAITKGGGFKPLDTGGVRVNPGVKTLDTGTGFVVIDSRTGRPVGQAGPAAPPAPGSGPAQSMAPQTRQGGPTISDIIGGGEVIPTPLQQPPTRPVAQGSYIPKDLRGAEAAKAEGKAQGTAVAEYQSITSKMPGLQSVVTKLDDLANKATYTYAGQGLDAGMRQLGMTPRSAAIARAQYTATVDNQILPLLRETFGAQFTEKEGGVLRATLGDPNKSPAEKQALLKAFIEQKQRDVEALRVRTGARPANRLRFNPQTGDFE